MGSFFSAISTIFFLSLCRWIFEYSRDLNKECLSFSRGFLFISFLLKNDRQLGASFDYRLKKQDNEIQSLKSIWLIFLILPDLIVLTRRWTNEKEKKSQLIFVGIEERKQKNENNILTKKRKINRLWSSNRTYFY